MRDSATYKRLQRTRRERAFRVSYMGEPLKRSVMRFLLCDRKLSLESCVL